MTGWGVSSGRLPLSPLSHADSRVVSLYADGQKRVVSTNATTVGEMLKDAGVSLRQGDLVEPAASAPITPGFFNVNVYRARAVTVVDGNAIYHLNSAYSSPRLLAEAAGLKIYPEDSYKTEVATDFVGQNIVGVKLTVLRSLPFTVVADGHTKQYRAQPGTVEAALTAADVKRGPQDILSVSPTAALSSNESIAITRVSTVTATQADPIAFATQTVNDATQPVGYHQVQTAGVNGNQLNTYRIHYRDGVETGRELLRSGAITPPVTQVTVVGTKVQYAGSVEYWRPFVVAAAAQYGVDAAKMMRIMSCESTGNALASNGTHFGLYQYLQSTWHSAGGSSDNIFDGATQINLTAKYMAAHGTAAWQCQ